MPKLIFATKNVNKVQEAADIVKPLGYEIISLRELHDDDEVIEDGYSFTDNAYLKAAYYFNKYHLPTIADDSGITISYFNDHPGVHSARFLGGNDYKRTNAFILDVMKDIQNRKCAYICDIAYCDAKGIEHFQGRLDGLIAYEAKGENGFGYDPIFYLEAYQKTLGQLPPEVKNTISHRYLALRKMVDHFAR